ncbi:hypothetical protein ACFYPA_12100 [Streptomyces sp. NPDC005775]
MADTLVLVVSELVANALRHGGGHYTLQLAAGAEASRPHMINPGQIPIVQ